MEIVRRCLLRGQGYYREYRSHSMVVWNPFNQQRGRNQSSLHPPSQDSYGKSLGESAKIPTFKP